MTQKSKIIIKSATRFADLFKVGIGPSSSHTVGPMNAANQFAQHLNQQPLTVANIDIILYGSLAWTGIGHYTDKAIILGLEGNNPATMDIEKSNHRLAQITTQKQISLGGTNNLPFDPATNIIFDRKSKGFPHPNTLDFIAHATDGSIIQSERFYSIGGGFIKTDKSEQQTTTNQPDLYPYSNMDELLEIAKTNNLTIAEITLANEAAVTSEEQILTQIHHIKTTMLTCIENGLNADGNLPGPLNVKKRAKELYSNLKQNATSNHAPADAALQFVSAFAIAVNEVNAAAGRIVTAPTNGAAGVVPAVLRYYLEFCPQADDKGVERYFLATTAIGGIVKRNASISGAEVGCQGEVGSAAAMAAAGLAAALGASNEQVENAAEIALEHHLGLTCDPIGGLVQVPCIERNAFGAIKAISAASLAMQGDGTHVVSLDQVIETMRQTGLDMSEKYRETSRGGLAVNVPEC